MLCTVAQPVLCYGDPSSTSGISIFILHREVATQVLPQLCFTMCFVSRNQVFQWCLVYLRNCDLVPNNPSHTSCMSIFISSYDFCKSLVATTVFYNVFRWFALDDFGDVLYTFAIAMLLQTTLPIHRACRFSFSYSNLSFWWTQWLGCLSYFLTLCISKNTP